jgi:hypothetical protein
MNLFSYPGIEAKIFMLGVDNPPGANGILESLVTAKRRPGTCNLASPKGFR